LHLDRSYDYPVIERQLRALGLDDFDIQRRGTKVPGVKKHPPWPATIAGRPVVRRLSDGE